MTSTIEQAQSIVNQPVTDAAAQGFPFRKAFQETAAERTALRQEERIHVGFDISLAIDMVLAAVTRIEPFKAEIAKLPLDHRLLAQLDTYAHAAGHAHARLNAINTPPEELKAVYEQAVECRATLYSDASNLVRHGLLNPDAVSAIKNEVGFRNVGYDVMTLVSLFREAETQIAGRTATLPADLDTAEQVASQLIELTARREERQLTQPLLVEDRLCALSLMVKAYQQTRRAIQFVRFDHGDADYIVPSIYTARGGRKRDDSPETTDGDSVIAPPVIAPVTTHTAALQPQTTANAAYPVVPLGAPGGNPFI